ncbi:MAG: adenylyl-sulfate kinase [Epulopiscium sp. Nuni2H_MBin003]|nr:MAG: adenylyl-sulfate kinase [Epulopiscium sp. Nuni2H_MBin003]
MNGLLKFITCGSVDDGKSTLIGHMLYDAKLIFADQKNALVLDSKIGSRGTDIDYSLLLDGLMAEREQGITIDVAYRYFNTTKRNFIVADTPGHEQYTRNMAVGASFADLAIILVDATKGILMQTKRHIRICNLMGIRHFVFAVNKMDLVFYDMRKFRKIEADITQLMQAYLYESSVIIPVSATEGDNITKASNRMKWYTGKTFLTYLEEVDISEIEGQKLFLMPIQRACRPNVNFRGFQGQVAYGNLKIGDEIIVLPTKEKANVKQLLNAGKECNSIHSSQAVTIILDKEIDCSRGCIISKNEMLSSYRLFKADLLWMDDEELIVGRSFLIKIGTKVTQATIIKIHYCIDINTGSHILQKKAEKNDLINCDISLAEKVVLDKFKVHKDLGRFILINRITHATSACGVIEHPLNRSDNLTWQNLDITKEIRANQKNQVPKTLWFTGLSGSGKSTIANALEKELVSQLKHTMILDGDNVRMGLNNNLGFSEKDRVENIRRIAEVAKIMNDAGLIVLVSAISPFAQDRNNAKKIIGEGFIEIYVATSLEECIRRDTKNLYKKALNGEVTNFTGISSPYEIPQKPDIIADTEGKTVEEVVHYILSELENIKI